MLLLDLMKREGLRECLDVAFFARFNTVLTIFDQQQALYENPESKVKNRIVSLHKPYLRPIKRGKEGKPTEFGAKVHIIQVDGLCIIEEFSWNAFHEGNRLQAAVKLHRELFDYCHQLSADKIYASNHNRRFCTREGIQTNFAGKGRKPKKEVQQLRAALNKDRSTRLEGSFGNQKNHYLLRKVKARNEHTEKIWVYFGVWTANAVWIYKQREKDKPKQVKRKAKRVRKLQTAA
jgi:hypothetical protein